MKYRITHSFRVFGLLIPYWVVKVDNTIELAIYLTDYYGVLSKPDVAKRMFDKTIFISGYKKWWGKRMRIEGRLM